MAEAHALGRAQAEARVLELEPLAAGSELERLAQVQRPAVRDQRLEHDGRRHAVHGHVARVDHDEALHGREIEAAVARAPARWLEVAVALRGRHAVGGAVRDDRHRSRAAPDELQQVGLARVEDPLVRRHPQPPVPVVEDLVDHVVEQAVLHVHDREAPVREPREPAVGADPEAALGVVVGRAHDRVRQALAYAVRDRGARAEAHDAGAHGADPQVARAVLDDREHGRRRIGRRQRHRLPAPVGLEAREAALGARPHAAVAVARDRTHERARQPVGDGVRARAGRAAHGQARARADPQRAGRVGRERERRRIGHARQAVRDRHPVARERHDAVVGRHPHGARAVLDDAAHQIRRQALAPGERRELGVAQAVEPAADGADPEAALAVLEQAEDHVARQALGAAVVVDAPVVDALQAAAERADPEVAVAVLVDRADHVAREAVPGGDVGNGAPLHHVEAALVVADPHAALAVDVHRAHPVAAEPVLRRVARERAALQAEETVAVGADPQPPLGVRVQGLHRLARETGHVAEAALVPAREPLGGADPEAARAVLGERVDEIAREAVARREIREGAVPVPGEPAADRRDPEVARAVGLQAPHHVAAQGRRVAGVEDGEARAVEAREPRLGREPEIAVRRLRDRVDRELRQPLLPHVLPVLGHGEARVERAGRVGRERHRCAGECEKERASRTRDHRAVWGHSSVVVPEGGQPEWSPEVGPASSSVNAKRPAGRSDGSWSRSSSWARSGG